MPLDTGLIKLLKKNKEEYNDYLLELALKEDLLDKFIAGTGFFEITAPPGMNIPPSYSAGETMRTIYRRYEKSNNQNAPLPTQNILRKLFKKHKSHKISIDNNKNIPLLTQNAFLKIFNTYKSKRILNAIDAINYHMTCEKNGKAPFKLDCQVVLEKARENIINNRDLFQNGEYSFWKELENADKRLNASHGMHIL